MSETTQQFTNVESVTLVEQISLENGINHGISYVMMQWLSAKKPPLHSYNNITPNGHNDVFFAQDRVRARVTPSPVRRTKRTSYTRNRRNGMLANTRPSWDRKSFPGIPGVK